MSRRDDRLQDPEAFRQALMSRPIARQGSFSVHRVAAKTGFKLGFVIPKKLVKTAVQRNQMKRWARAIFRAFETSPSKTESWVLRVRQSFPKSAWQVQGRIQARQDIRHVMESAFQR